MSPFQNVRRNLENIKLNNKRINAICHISPKESLLNQSIASSERWKNGTQKSTIDGMTMVIKDNICTTDLPTSCASKMLQGYISPFDATVVKLLKEAGVIIIGKSNMDEFGMGYFGPVLNPVSSKFLFTPGGSSGGSAASVAADFCDAALGSDTGGSVRLPASYCGVIGFKPTYGRFSRLGLVSYASSLDTIGILGKSINHIENIFQIISVKDPQDMTSQSFSKGTDLLPGSSLRGITVGVPNEYYLEELSNDVVISWSNGIKKLESKGAKIIPISLPSTPKALQSYYIIAPAEASSNLARYDGMRYGYKSENPDLDGLYSATRSEGFGTQVQERIKLGSFVLEADSFNAYFKQAQVVREEVGKDFDRVFRFNNEHGLCDVLITPAAPTTAPRFQDIESESVTEYQNDVMTVPASLAGIPAIVVPFGKGSSDGLPIGLQLLAQKGDDELLFNISRHLLM